MDKEALKTLQNTELTILEAISCLCEKQGIRYFLDSGTLIGAMRHNGFIPWDDDVDITMPYKDYLRFLEIAPEELGEEYFIQNHETENNFFRSYTKVSLNGTTVIPREWDHWDIHHGAWVDIFPMFYSDSEKDIRKKAKLYKLCSVLQMQNYYHSCMMHSKRSLKTSITYAALLLIGIIPIKTRKRIHNRLLKHIFSKEDGQYLCRCAIIVRKFEKRSFLGDPRRHQFEHLSLSIPSDAEKVLRDEYGDYMQLPPENKRGTHGEVLVIV
ncbi:MAG: LicD family protein [Clostridia bacterium]|nr:LicD family protein [Clostridia bacterium]